MKSKWGRKCAASSAEKTIVPAGSKNNFIIWCMELFQLVTTNAAHPRLFVALTKTS